MFLVLVAPPGLVEAIYILIYFLVFLLILCGFYFAIRKIAPAELQNILVGVLIVVAIIALALGILSYMGGR